MLAEIDAVCFSLAASAMKLILYTTQQRVFNCVGVQVHRT